MQDEISAVLNSLLLTIVHYSQIPVVIQSGNIYNYFADSFLCLIV